MTSLLPLHQRFTFRFWNAAEYRGEEVTLIGLHHDDARSGAWAILGERTYDRSPRERWRLVSMAQEPLILGERVTA